LQYGPFIPHGKINHHRYFLIIQPAEAGAKTVLLEKADKSYMGAMWMAAIDSKLQKSLGVKIDKHEAVAEICRYGGHLADQKLVKLWADKS
jgi:fumarate reductase flavoprotein subunit